MGEEGEPVFGGQPGENAGLSESETDALLWLEGSPEAHGSRKIGDAQAAVTIETEQSSHARSEPRMLTLESLRFRSARLPS